MCIPNENLTDLLEFCYSKGQIQITKGKQFCLDQEVQNGMLICHICVRVSLKSIFWIILFFLRLKKSYWTQKVICLLQTLQRKT